MATDLHKGRSSPTFVVEGNPDTFIGILKRHGVLASVMRARKCPCITITSSPDIYCKLCHGDGYIYDFQRKFLQADEDSDIRKDRTIVYPFRVPVLEPLSVERLLPPEQGGIKKYEIESFDSYSIRITGNPLPYHWNKMRVSYYFDRYNEVQGDLVTVYPNTKTLITTQTRYDGEHAVGNVENMHGDLAIINRIYDKQLEHTFENYTFKRNRIQLADSEPTPTPGQVEVDYFYVPLTFVAVADLESQNDVERWITTIANGQVRMSVEPWYELSPGDIITLAPVEFYRDDIITHSSYGFDKLNEFDVFKLGEEIIDEDGVKYQNNVDYYLRPFRDIVWIGKQPNAGKKISVRFGYHPSYVIFINNPVPNNLENKKYPKTFIVKNYNMTLQKDLEQMSNTEYSPETGNPNPVDPGSNFVEF